MSFTSSKVGFTYWVRGSVGPCVLFRVYTVANFYGVGSMCFAFTVSVCLVFVRHVLRSVFCYWCKGARTNLISTLVIRSRTRQSERVKSIFRISASKPTIHIDLTESGLDSGTTTIGGAATRDGHAVRGGAATRGSATTQGGHAFRGGGTSGAAS